MSDEEYDLRAKLLAQLAISPPEEGLVERVAQVIQECDGGELYDNLENIRIISNRMKEPEIREVLRSKVEDLQRFWNDWWDFWEYLYIIKDIPEWYEAEEIKQVIINYGLKLLEENGESIFEVELDHYLAFPELCEHKDIQGRLLLVAERIDESDKVEHILKKLESSSSQEIAERIRTTTDPVAAIGCIRETHHIDSLEVREAALSRMAEIAAMVDRRLERVELDDAIWDILKYVWKVRGPELEEVMRKHESMIIEKHDEGYDFQEGPEGSFYYPGLYREMLQDVGVETGIEDERFMELLGVPNFRKILDELADIGELFKELIKRGIWGDMTKTIRVGYRGLADEIVKMRWDISHLAPDSPDELIRLFTLTRKECEKFLHSCIKNGQFGWEDESEKILFDVRLISRYDNIFYDLIVEFIQTSPVQADEN